MKDGSEDRIMGRVRPTPHTAQSAVHPNNSTGSVCRLTRVTRGALSPGPGSGFVHTVTLTRGFEAVHRWAGTGAARKHVDVFYFANSRLRFESPYRRALPTPGWPITERKLAAGSAAEKRNRRNSRACARCHRTHTHTYKRV